MERTAAIPLAGRLVPRSPKRVLALRSDDRLVELVRGGDDVAFEVLYERHIAGLLGFCRHMLGSQAEAEDAVQQAFVSAHGAMRRGGREINFKPWLYTIARNRCLSMLRARREQPAELPEISTAGLNEQVERSAELRELVADVQRLPEHQRAALVLSELGDLSHKEVAEVIGFEPQAIKGLVFRARASLAERRDARDADCGDIRLELAAATGGGLRRGRLRYHLESCPGCVAYLQEVKRQRKLLGIALPVVPTLALKDSVMSGAGIGAGAAGMGVVGGSGGLGAAAGGVSAIGGAAAGGAVKLAVTAAILAGGAGVATEAVISGGADAPPSKTSSSAGEESAGSGREDGSATTGTPGDDKRALRALEGGIERRAPGQQRAGQRGGGRSAGGGSQGKALGRERGRALGRGDPKAVGGGRQGAADTRGGTGSAPRAGTPSSQRGGKQGVSPGRSDGQGSVAPRQKPASPAKPVPRATPPPAASKGGSANRPAFRRSADAVP